MVGGRLVHSLGRLAVEQILVYGDSLSWGIVPLTRQRLPFARRWPGVLENALLEAGEEARVIENCLNGRRTVWDDPFKEGRNGTQGLAQVIEMHSPLSVVILMLGLNDFQAVHGQNNAWCSARGTARLIDIVREAPIEPDMPIPQILVVAPPPIGNPAGAMADRFLGAEERADGLAWELERVCEELDAAFFDAGEVIESSVEDGVHLDAREHQILGNALAPVVIELLNSDY